MRVGEKWRFSVYSHPSARMRLSIGACSISSLKYTYFAEDGTMRPSFHLISSDAARIQTVSSQIHPFGWNDVRNAPVASVAEKQHKTFRVRIDGKMISREAAQTDGARAHPSAALR